jgi:hypothetical protein
VASEHCQAGQTERGQRELAVAMERGEPRGSELFYGGRWGGGGGR